MPSAEKVSITESGAGLISYIQSLSPRDAQALQGEECVRHEPTFPGQRVVDVAEDPDEVPRDGGVQRVQTLRGHPRTVKLSDVCSRRWMSSASRPPWAWTIWSWTC